MYTGLFPSRDQDRIGVAVTRANNGTGYSERMLTAGSPVTTAELAIELTYRAQLAVVVSAARFSARNSSGYANQC